MSRRLYSYAVQMQRQQAAAARLAERETREKQRALEQAAKEAKLQYVDRRQHEAETQTQDVVDRMSAIENFLPTQIQRSYVIDFQRLKGTAQLPTFDARGLDRPIPEPQLILPPTPNFFVRLFPALMRGHELAVATALRDHDRRRAERTQLEANREKKLDELRQQYDADCARIVADTDVKNNEVDGLRHDYERGVAEAVAHYFELAFDDVRLPDGFPDKTRIAYVTDSHQLVLERDLPALSIIPTAVSYRYIKASDTIEQKTRPAAQIHGAYSSLVAQFALAWTFVVFNADYSKVVDVLALSCFVDTIDPTTGKPIRPCLFSLRVTRDVFDGLDLTKVDAVACVRSLGARVSPSPHELVPVQPVVNFNMVDPRFIGKSDVLSELDTRPNLAELTPSEFEALMTNLFEKMGLETRLTRPSRDGGVDCVAWEKREVLSGKVVIQAKRYRHTVGVGAVRDLYGTMTNEGASKGLLVATSHYGKSAYEFASNKPLELITGENLLYLLKQYANVDAKIEFPDEWVDPIPNLPEPAEDHQKPG